MIHDPIIQTKALNVIASINVFVCAVQSISPYLEINGELNEEITANLIAEEEKDLKYIHYHVF